MITDKLIIDLEKINLDNSTSTYQTHYVENFTNKISEYTCGLDKVIPWTNDMTNGFIWSGGLLYDTIIDRKASLDTLMDIDLFFYGNNEYKLQTLSQILVNLTNCGYKYLVGFNKSVVYIFIQGIPRIIQLIFTAKTNPQEIINTFDLTHLQSFYDGSKLYSLPTTINRFKDKLTSINPTHNKVKPSRLIKYLKRGIRVDELLYSDYNFILDDKQHWDLRKHLVQTKIYQESNNLTINTNGQTIDFETHFEPILSLGFWCKIMTKDKLKYLIDNNYYLTDNKIIVKDKITNGVEFADLISDLEDYLKLDLAGNFDNLGEQFDLDLEDDVLEHIKIHNMYKLKYQTQKYIYIPCKIVNKHCWFNENYFDFQITKLRVIDYLIGLTDDIYNDIIAYDGIIKNNNPNNLINANNPINANYLNFTFPFINSLTFPKLKSKYKDMGNEYDDDEDDDENKNKEVKYEEYMTDGIVNEYGLVWRTKVSQDIYELYDVGTELYVMCGISLYSTLGHMGGVGNMFGYKLKPYLFDKIEI